ncbi:MAG: hypothetical protein AMJ64_11095 [Betaproteobacteria bacterium SG8_39]|nr:MAG: hypothetical protein AMJ64_11095 [Betaproteobacteria bacterium SG8_39]
MIPISEPSPERPTGGFALFALGFRPFYLLAALYSALAVLVWHAVLRGLPWQGFLSPLAWHQHEMTFGFALAVVAGFLLTAGRVWTGLRTPEGLALAALAAHWIVARILMFTGPALAAGLVDGSFPFVLAAVMARVIVASRNWRNLFVVGLLALLGIANVGFHLEHARVLDVPADLPLRAALFLVLFLVVVMAGRVIPGFTANALPKAGVRRWPRLDQAALGCTALAFAGATFAGAAWWVASAAVLAAVLHVLRQWGWRSFATHARPILWILHLSHAWIPVGCGLLALNALGWVAQPVALHALGVGALGGTVIGMITRTALGHTGRALAVGRLEIAAYLMVHAAALARVAAGLVPELNYAGLVAAAAWLWAGAFVIYFALYLPRLVRPRVDGRPG